MDANPLKRKGFADDNADDKKDFLSRLRLNKKQLMQILVLVVITIAVRGIFIPEKGYVGDRIKYLSWANSANNSAFGEVYKKSGSDNMPLILLMHREALAFNAFFNIKMSPMNFLKIPAIILEALSVIAIFYIMKKIDSKHAFFAGLLYALNPALIFDTAYWGQTDTLFFILCAIAFIQIPEFSLMFAALSIFYKLQNAIFFPPLLFFIIKKYDFKRLLSSLLAFVIVIIAVSYPFLSIQNAADIKNIVFNSFSEYPYITLNAYNLWKIVDCLSGRCRNEWWNSIGDATKIGFVSLKNIGFALFFILLVISLLYLNAKIKDSNRKKNKKISKEELKSILAACALIAFSFFMLATEMHERYLFYTIPLLIPLYFVSKEYKVLYRTLTSTFFVNIVIILSSTFRNNVFEKLIADSVGRGYFIPLIISLINVIIFSMLSVMIIKEIRKKKRCE